MKAKYELQCEMCGRIFWLDAKDVTCEKSVDGGSIMHGKCACGGDAWEIEATDSESNE